MLDPHGCFTAPGELPKWLSWCCILTDGMSIVVDLQFKVEVWDVTKYQLEISLCVMKYPLYIFLAPWCRLLLFVVTVAFACWRRAAAPHPSPLTSPHPHPRPPTPRTHTHTHTHTHRMLCTRWLWGFVFQGIYVLAAFHDLCDFSGVIVKIISAALHDLNLICTGTE